MIIKNNSIKEIEFGPIKVKELFTKNDQSVSFAEIRLSGKNKKNKNKVSDIYYFVVEGSGKFFIDNVEHNVETGDLVLVPKNTEYYDEGGMRLFSISTPAFNQKNVEYSE